MNLAEVMLPRKPRAADYSKLDSRSLLSEAVKTYEALTYVGAALRYQSPWVDKEFKANGLSEVALQLFDKTTEMMRNQQMLGYELEAMTSEIGRRIFRNATNRYFGLLTIGGLRNDMEAQKNAMQNLYRLLGSIPSKNGWFHPEETEAIDSLTNLLLAKELHKYRHLDLPATLEHMMDNRFNYMYRAYECDFKDEIDKLERRPFESPLDPDSISPAKLGEDHFVVRLDDVATEQKDPIKREIILATEEIASRALEMSERAIRAEVVNRVSRKMGVSKQWVRRQLNKGVALPELKQAMELDAPEERIRVILTDEEEK